MEIRIPHLAEGVESGTVVSILVKVGDAVQKDQTLLELETSKAVAPLPSPAAGVVSQILVKEGDEVAVRKTVIVLGEEGQSAVAAAAKEPESLQTPSSGQRPAPAPEQSVVSSATMPAQSAPSRDYRYESKAGFEPPASPTVRRMARELGIDLTRIQGSERGGRITVSDLRAYIQYLQQAVASARVESAAVAAPGETVSASVDYSKWGPVEKITLSSLRRKIAEKMSASWSQVPHVTQFEEADITDLLAWRKKYNSAFEAQGVRLTVTPLILKALVGTLQRHPVFNASLDLADRVIVYKEYYHLGIAVDTEQGLIVPVIRDADKKDLLELSRELNEVAEKTRQRKISLEDLQGGTFTVSNQGGIGGGHFTPIINTPEVAVVGLGKGQLKPVIRDGKIVTRMMLPLCLSYDHRVIDGAAAARFIVDFRNALEHFDESVAEVSSKQSKKGK
jgi:pyruvate dehydrogenase E2 component (dihydrolipoyllysine-residue acetyltransferase)